MSENSNKETNQTKYIEAGTSKKNDSIFSKFLNKLTPSKEYTEGLTDEIKLTEKSMSGFASKINPKVYYAGAGLTVLALVIIFGTQ